MINLIVQSYNDNKYGIILNSITPCVTVLTQDLRIVEHGRTEIIILNKNKQLSIYHKYFSDIIEIPQHLIKITNNDKL